tara:strand:+ start:183 stop:1085 length:903 start_codon:yes stop_codon:yes gene_type:complete
VEENPNYAILVTGSLLNSVLPASSSLSTKSTDGLTLFQESLSSGAKVSTPSHHVPPSSQGWLCHVINGNRELKNQAVWLVETCSYYSLCFIMPTYLGDGTHLRLWGAHFPVIGEVDLCPGIKMQSFAKTSSSSSSSSIDTTTRSFIGRGDGQLQRHETGRMKASSMNIFLFVWKAALRAENKTEEELPLETFLNQFLFMDLSGVAGRANDQGVFVGTNGVQVPALVESEIRKRNLEFNRNLLVAVAVALEEDNEFADKNSIDQVESIIFCKGIHDPFQNLIEQVNRDLVKKKKINEFRAS